MSVCTCSPANCSVQSHLFLSLWRALSIFNAVTATADEYCYQSAPLPHRPQCRKYSVPVWLSGTFLMDRWVALRLCVLFYRSWVPHYQHSTTFGNRFFFIGERLGFSAQTPNWKYSIKYVSRKANPSYRSNLVTVLKRWRRLAWGTEVLDCEFGKYCETSHAWDCCKVDLAG